MREVYTLFTAEGLDVTLGGGSLDTHGLLAPLQLLELAVSPVPLHLQLPDPSLQGSLPDGGCVFDIRDLSDGDRWRAVTREMGHGDIAMLCDPVWEWPSVG